MKFILIPALLLASVYPFSYARYNVTKKNYLGAVGMILLALFAVAFPAYLLLAR